MTEQKALRTYTQKIYDLPNGQRRLRAHAGHIHFVDDVTGALEDIDHTWADRGTYWEMTKASYRMRVAKDFAAPQLIQYTNKFGGANHTMVYEPHSLIWATGRDLADVRPYKSQQSVQGVVNGPIIRWTDAFGPGLHFEVGLRGSGFIKELVIQRRNALDIPPTAQHRLILLSRYTGSGLDVKDTSGRVWQKSREFDNPTDDGYRVEEPTGKHSLIRPAYIREANAPGEPRNRQHRCPVVWTQRNGALWQAKVLPTAVLTNGTYPLRADTVTSYYAGAGDGHVAYEDSTTWATAHDAATGTRADGTGTAVSVSSTKFTFYGVFRGFFPFVTSGIGSGATVNSATLYLRAFDVGVTDNDGDDFFVPVGPTTQVDPTSLVVADFDTCAATASPQELSSDRKDSSSVSTIAYSSWVLNATGISNVNVTGTTLIGLREGHDVVDSAIAAGFGSYVYADIYSSEATGTGNDPYLEVDYTPAGGGSGARAVFLPLLGVA